MHLFHKWEKWSQPKEQIFKKRIELISFTDPIITRDVVILTQHRRCEKCGLYQERSIDAPRSS